jgi:hypothetical protein
MVQIGMHAVPANGHPREPRVVAVALQVSPAPLHRRSPTLVSSSQISTRLVDQLHVPQSEQINTPTTQLWLLSHAQLRAMDTVLAPRVLLA